jgi:hypothetical protein
MRFQRLRAASVLSVVFAAVLGATAIPSAQALPDAAFARSSNGTLSGTVATAPASAVGFSPVVVAERLDSPGDNRSTVANGAGAFRLSVPAGLWLVRTPTWKNGHLGFQTRVVPVAGGKSYALRASVRAGGQIPPVRIAATPWTINGSFDPYLGRGLGSLVGGETVRQADKACGSWPGRSVAIVEAHEGSAWQGILREIKLGVSKYATPEFRALARKALVATTTWAPTHKLTGTATQSIVNGVDTYTFDARMVNAGTGEVEWQKTYTTPVTEDVFKTLDQISVDALGHFCSIPEGLHISTTATVNGSDDDASASAVLQADYDVWQRPGEETNYQASADVFWKVVSSTFSGKETSCQQKLVEIANLLPGWTATAGAAVISPNPPHTVRVFIGGGVGASWVDVSPPDECTNTGTVPLVFNVGNLTVPLGGTGSASGPGVPGVTYTIKATVTPLSR